MEQTIWVYIIKSEQGRHYTGITNDIFRRFREHKGGLSKSTARFRSIELVWLKGYSNRERAREIEVRIKKKGAARWMKVYGELEKEKGGIGGLIGESKKLREEAQELLNRRKKERK